MSKEKQLSQLIHIQPKIWSIFKGVCSIQNISISEKLEELMKAEINIVFRKELQK